MKFRKLAEYLEKIEKTDSRLKMTEILAELYKECSSEEIDQVVYLSLGRLGPKFKKEEFNLAEKMMLRVIVKAYEKDLKEVKKAYKKVGDLGEVVKELEFKEGSHKTLSVAEVYKRLLDIAIDEGEGSQERKVNNMARLIGDLDLLSVRYVLRIPVKKLRLGFSDMTILDALSWMEKGDKSLRDDLERAFNVSADIGRIAQVFKEKGLKGIGRIEAEPGVPIRVCLAERLPSAEKIVEKLEVFAVERKYDGLRVQIHLDKTKKQEAKKKELFLFDEQENYVKIFSRNLDDMTHMFPDIIREVEKLEVKQVILDGEAIAYDPKTGKLLNFQKTVQRKRKHGVKKEAEDKPLKVMVYDLLYLNGEQLLTKPFKKRRRKLEEVFKGVKGDLKLADQEIVSDAKQLKELVKKYLDEGLEGAMCKKLTTEYKAGSRNFNWVKYKKTTEGELADTIDGVMMGYYAGKGRRSGFGIGAFLVGILDSKGKIGSIAKIGTGVSDEQWAEIRQRADRLKTDKKPDEYVVDKNLECDVWVKPKIVVEVMADEITKSPIHAFDLALRFPRFVKFREDKEVSQATSKKEFERLYKMQGV